MASVNAKTVAAAAVKCLDATIDAQLTSFLEAEDARLRLCTKCKIGVVLAT